MYRGRERERERDRSGVALYNDTSTMVVRRASPWGLILMTVGVVAADTARAGPWSRLPDAVARLHASSSEREAREVLRQAERSVLQEAVAGRIAAVEILVDAYDAHVTPLAGGDVLVERLERQAATALADWGDDIAPRDAVAAGRAWSAAARLDPRGAAVDRLRERLLPPVTAEPGQVWRSPADDADLVFHPAVAYRMGCSPGDRECREDERYFRWVELAPLWVDRTEVTNRSYRRCVASGWCDPPLDPAPFDDRRRDDHPVVGLTWHQAEAYARWAGRRLPTEAEWERVARGRELDRRFPWGDERLEAAANVQPEAGRASGGTTAVGAFEATGWGIHDIAGNVFEWCRDRYQSGLKQVPDDGGPVVDGWGRVLRGGSWRRTLVLSRVSARDWRDEGYRADDLGLRAVVDPPGRIPTSDLVELATRLFPGGSGSPRALEGSALTTADRRYLERRALTWLVLENRIGEALAQAGVLLARSSRDPVVAVFLDRFERDLLVEIEIGDVRQAAAWVERFRRSAEEFPDIGRRFRSKRTEILEALRARAEEAMRSRRRGQAQVALRAALDVDPDDPVLPRLLAATVPSAGDVRRWDGDDRDMVWIPAGTFRMGASVGDTSAQNDEHPARSVRVEGFWLDRREVTNADYRRCVEAGACSPPRQPVMYDDPNLRALPVMWVDWHQAREYARWAGKRLPTEAEWEHAARGDQQTRYPWGTVWREGAANGLGTAGDDRFGGAAPVGSFAPDRWGLYDMLGNAAEWVEDLYHRDYRDAPRDARAWNQLTGGPVEHRRVIRGGSYDDPPNRMRVSSRASRPPLDAYRTTGFRCAADIEER